jgi:ribosomal protein L27
MNKNSTKKGTSMPPQVNGRSTSNPRPGGVKKTNSNVVNAGIVHPSQLNNIMISQPGSKTHGQ